MYLILLIMDFKPKNYIINEKSNLIIPSMKTLKSSRIKNCKNVPTNIINCKSYKKKY